MNYPYRDGSVSIRSCVTVAHRMKIPGRFFGAFLFFLVLSAVTIPPAVADAPVANFTGIPASGPAPLTVSFTDRSANNPSSWAWFFGDENFTSLWKQVTVSAGWSARMGQSSVVMPDGSILLMGGYSGGYSRGPGALTGNSAPWMQMVASPGLPSGYQQMSRVILNNYIVLPGNYGGYDNDVWRSMDDGTTWTQVTVSPGWPARAGQNSVVMPDGSIVLMGGYGSGGFRNDVWGSADDGATWTQVTISPGWSGRTGQSSVVMPDGSIILMGGWSGQVNNDVWKSTDDGATWSQVTVSPGWSGRTGQSSVVMPDGSIVLMGGWDQYGGYKNDVWRSTDDGATWRPMTMNAGWPARAGQSSVVMPDGSIVLMGGWSGGYDNDVWRSVDDGAIWKQITVSPGWSGRTGQSSVVMPDGSIVLMGGWSGQENGDVWRLMPAGSSEQSPSHTYTTPGLYQVTLEANNANGSNTRIQSNYINVFALPRTVTIPAVRYSASSTSPGSGPVPPVSVQPTALPTRSPTPSATIENPMIPMTTRASLPATVSIVASIIAGVFIAKRN